MKTHEYWVPLRRVGVGVVAVVLMTVAFWTLKQPSSVVVKAQNGLGSPIPNLTPFETTLFNSGLQTFIKRWDPTLGLGPVFTQFQCNQCHFTPVNGGNSTKIATSFGKINDDGSFNPLTNEGGILRQPLSVSRFRPACVLQGEIIPADATIKAVHVTPQAFGFGLIDSVSDDSILAQALFEQQNQTMGVAGIANMVTDEKGNLRPGRFGYKAQAATLVQMIAQAMTHEIGITNPIVPDEDLPQGNPIPHNCNILKQPNDFDGSQMIANLHFLIYLAPNTANIINTNGQALFTSVGCALCHITPDIGYTTGSRIVVPVEWNGRTLQSKALSSQPVPLYSDLLLHDMGPGLADNIPAGSATGSMFRTTPLWGLSTRTRYLHDGSSLTLDNAIRRHDSSGSEATQVIANYKALSAQDQADLIAFINSL